MKMITLLLAGGLGNQMFQYAFARCLALRNGMGLRMSRYYCTPRVSRPYALNNLNLSEDVKLMTKAQEYIAVTKYRVVNKLCKFFKHKNNFVSKNEVSPSMFAGKLGHVVITGDAEADTEGLIGEHEHMELVQITHTSEELGGEWWFVLRDIPEAEIERERLRGDVDYLAMMTGVEL